MWPPKSLLYVSISNAAHVAFQEHHIYIYIYIYVYIYISLMRPVWPPESLLYVSISNAAHVAIQESPVIFWTSCGPCGLLRASCIIARRHGHVFRMALHNEGDWRMETWQRARRASCHVSIRQSPSCVMPFWTHAKCLLAFISNAAHVAIKESPVCI